jgi:predicted lipoprotein
MYGTMDRRRLLLALAAAGAALQTAGCKILPIAKEGEGAASGAFDAKAYADGLWASQVLPHFASTAHPIGDVLEAIRADLDAAGERYGYRPATEGSPWTFVVTGQGTVVSKNTESRAGSLVVRLATPSADEIAIQIGPVVRGNAVRDSLPFVPFKDFTNQLEFADVGKAFTALAMAAVEADVAAVTAGDEVMFTGAISLNTKADMIVMTPVSLKAAG